MQKIEKVHVVFKTHLDIGFTDLAANVVQRYLDTFIPKAIDLAARMRSESQDRFIWTAGSWLIHHALNHSKPADKARLVAAIEQGDIRWHGYPFTTHTELMAPDLFDFGLSLSQDLDRRFKRQTIAAKMTDVPGHTRALVTHFARAGLQYLHIGSNRSMKGPALPALSRWKGREGHEIIIHYSHSYGDDSAPLPGFPEIIVFAHTGDNCGPPSFEELQEEFDRIRQKYPGARVQASTLDDFAQALARHRELLPVFDEEIADNWIYGTGSDPLKVAHFRELLRLRKLWMEEGSFDADSPGYHNFHEQLLLVTEHTWGMDEKLHLPDFHSYSKADFNKSREKDLLDESQNPVMYEYISKNSADHFNYLLGEDAAKEAMSERSFSRFESSWQEQRDYLTKAINGLDKDKKIQALKSLEHLKPSVNVPPTAAQLSCGEYYDLGSFSVAFGEDGSLIRLLDSNKKDWAGSQNRIGSYSYDTFGEADYQSWFRTYTSNWKITRVWAQPDMGKPGIEMMTPPAARKEFKPHLLSLHHIEKEEADTVWAGLSLPMEAYDDFGGPKDLAIRYDFYKGKTDLDITLYCLNQDAYRPPEASWFSIAPAVGNPNRWLMDKLGEPVSPLQVVQRGNRYMHSINSALTYSSTDGQVTIEALDSPLVCPGAKWTLRFDDQVAPLAGGWHFNLHNNFYGTNFRMWFEDDMLFRYRLKFKSNMLVD